MLKSYLIKDRCYHCFVCNFDECCVWRCNRWFVLFDVLSADDLVLIGESVEELQLKCDR